MPEPTPEQDVAAKLAGAGGLGAGFVVGTNIFCGPVRPQQPAGGAGPPAQAVFVQSSGGPAPEPYLGGASGGSSYPFAIQVRVRSGPEDYLGGVTIGRNARALLHKGAISGYTSCLSKQADPIYLAQDRQGNHEWSLNFELRRAGTP